MASFDLRYPMVAKFGDYASAFFFDFGRRRVDFQAREQHQRPLLFVSRFASPLTTTVSPGTMAADPFRAIALKHDFILGPRAKRQREDGESPLEAAKQFIASRGAFISTDYEAAPGEGIDSPAWIQHTANEAKRLRAHLKPTYEDVLPRLAKIYLKFKRATNNFADTDPLPEGVHPQLLRGCSFNRRR